eukprot:6191175-Pleurochrysis_carterae.AAC.1
MEANRYSIQDEAQQKVADTHGRSCATHMLYALSPRDWRTLRRVTRTAADNPTLQDCAHKRYLKRA